MHYNDRLETLLAQQPRDASAKAALWAQIADVMAQDGDRLSPAQGDAGYARLRLWRGEIPAGRRMVIAESLSFHVIPAELLGLFGEESPRIAAPLLGRARMAENDWLRLIPDWPPTSRALLRERRDLPPGVTRLLAAYGTSDMMLAGEAGPAAEAGSSIQIRDLVARIEAYRRDHQGIGQPAEDTFAIHDFRFESGPEGLINWVEGAPRGPTIGISLAEMAEPGGFGVDGHAAGACRQRAAFRDARLLVAGSGEVSGQWLISADPLFNPEDGRFVGYRGIARRPDLRRQGTPPMIGGGLSPDSLRQLVHELRTPLNAIRGFAEMIEGRLMGPVAHDYRDRAGTIVRDSARLLSVIDDLDSAARLQAGAWPDVSAADNTDLAKILTAVAKELRPWTEKKAVRLRVVIEQDMPHARVDHGTAERLFGRLLETVIALATSGEELGARLAATPSGIAFRLDRPRALHGLDAEGILAAASSDVDDEAGAPPLGTGFTFRLIGAMARASDGHFEIEREKFGLILPYAGDSARENKEIG